jgi:hypothetical protein
MRYRFVFFTGLGIGFVLGARAGRERYEQIRKLARKAADSPAVQQAAGALQAQAASYAKAAGGKVAGRAGQARAKVGGALHDHVPGMRARESNGHPADGGRGHYVRTPEGPPGG